MKKIMLLSLCATILLFAQCKKDKLAEPVTKFKTVLNNASGSYYLNVIPTADGYVLNLETYDDDPAIKYKLDVVFLDKQGVIKSSNTLFTGLNLALIKGLISSQNGECVGAGQVESMDNGQHYVPLFARIDSKGFPIWIKKVPTFYNLPQGHITRDEAALAVVESSEKRIFALLRMTARSNMTIMILDEAGNLLQSSQQTYPISSAAMVADDDGSVYAFTGTTTYTNGVASGSYATLNKFDKNGVSLWSKTFADASAYVSSITKIGSDIYFATSNAPTNATTLYKANANGETTIIKNFGEIKNARIILKTTDNNLVICSGDINGNTEMVKVSLTGTELWRKTFPSYLRDVKTTPDDGFVVLTGNPGQFLFKTDSEGNFE